MRLTKRDKFTGAAKKAAESNDKEILERLCEYEDAAEEVGLDGPYAVTAILRVAKEGIGKRIWKYLETASNEKKNAAPGEEPARRCCGDCRHFERQLYYGRGECMITVEKIRMRGGTVQSNRHRSVSDHEQACKWFDPIDKQEAENRLERQKIIKMLREYCELKQTETAEYLGVTQQTHRHWENLQTITNTDAVLKTLCELIGWSWPLFRVLVLDVPLEQAARDQKEDLWKKSIKKRGGTEEIRKH